MSMENEGSALAWWTGAVSAFCELMDGMIISGREPHFAKFVPGKETEH